MALTEVLFAVLFAWLVLAESQTPVQLVGGLLTVVRRPRGGPCGRVPRPRPRRRRARHRAGHAALASHPRCGWVQGAGSAGAPWSDRPAVTSRRPVACAGPRRAPAPMRTWPSATSSYGSPGRGERVVLLRDLARRHVVPLRAALRQPEEQRRPRKRVDLVLSVQKHLYQRTKQLREGADARVAVRCAYSPACVMRRARRGAPAALLGAPATPSL